MAFSDLGLSGKVLQAVESSGYTQPTPIQSEAIPHVLARRDVLGIAQTGTGKTAAFTLPMLTLLETGRARARMPRTLILEPTRELAAQVEDSFIKYGVNHRLNVALLIGGVSFADQDAKITRGVDVLIATPGRLLDHFERGKLLLSGIEVLVIDEADRMLDMGFIPDIERICKMVPFTRQTLFFSATMPPEIQKLVDNFLSNPARVEVARASSTATTISQLAVASGADASQKRKTLRRLISGAEDLKNGIIFCNRKRDIAVVQKSLEKHGFSVVALHGDMDQRSRMQALDQFRNNEVQLLVASDVAARGLDIPDVSHVFNYDTPHHAEDYVHRIGRTGRAGRKGTAYTIITSDDAKSAAAIVAMSGKEFEWLGPTLEDARFTDADDGEAREHRHDRKRGKDGRRGREGSGREGSGRESGSRDGSGREKNRREPAQADALQAQEQQPQPRHPVAESRHAPRPEGRNGQRDDRRGRNGRHDRERDRERDEPTAPGFGDHTPAFMLVAAPDARRTSGGKSQRHAGPVTPVAIMPTAQDRLTKDSPVQDLSQAEQPSALYSNAPGANGNADSPDAGGGERRERRKRDRRRRGGRRDGGQQAIEAAVIDDIGVQAVTDGDAAAALSNETVQRAVTPTASVQVIAIEERATAAAAPVEQAPVPAEVIPATAPEAPVAEVTEKPKPKRASRKAASTDVEVVAKSDVVADAVETAAAPAKATRTRARKVAVAPAVQDTAPVVASSDAAPVEVTGETPAAAKPAAKARAPRKAAAKAPVADAADSSALAGTAEASETAAPAKKPSSRRKPATAAAETTTATVVETTAAVIDEAQAPKAARSSRTRTRRSARAPGQEQTSTDEPADS